MTLLRIKHKVRDYDSWKTAFDNFRDTRKKGGEKSYRVYQAANDPNYVDCTFEWDSDEKARKFLESPELRDAMEKAGVMEAPEISFLKEVDKGTL